MRYSVYLPTLRELTQFILLLPRLQVGIFLHLMSKSRSLSFFCRFQRLAPLSSWWFYAFGNPRPFLCLLCRNHIPTSALPKVWFIPSDSIRQRLPTAISLFSPRIVFAACKSYFFAGLMNLLLLCLRQFRMID